MSIVRRNSKCGLHSCWRHKVLQTRGSLLSLILGVLRKKQVASKDNMWLTPHGVSGSDPLCLNLRPAEADADYLEHPERFPIHSLEQTSRIRVHISITYYILECDFSVWLVLLKYLFNVAPIWKLIDGRNPVWQTWGTLVPFSLLTFDGFALLYFQLV